MPRVTQHHHEALLGTGSLALVSALALAAGLVATLMLIKAARQRAQNDRLQPRDDLQELLFAALDPKFREYLQTSSPAAAVREQQDDVPALLGRLRYIFFDEPEHGPARMGREEIAVGVAVLEARLNSLVATVERIERTGISQDKLIVTVVGVFATLLTLLGGTVGLIAVVVNLLS